MILLKTKNIVIIKFKPHLVYSAANEFEIVDVTWFDFKKNRSVVRLGAINTIQLF